MLLRRVVVASGLVVPLSVAACVAVTGPAVTDPAVSPGASFPARAAAGGTAPSPAATGTPPVRAVGSVTPSPVAEPPAAAPCPDLSAVPVALAVVIATGPEELAACARAQGVSTVVVEAWFPAVDCGACGAEGPMVVLPGWLSGTYVAWDAHTGALAAGDPRDGWDGMRVTTGPPPAGLSAEDADAWEEAHGATIRVPPSLGSCTTMSTRPDTCSFAAYSDRILRITTHLFDPAAGTCSWEGPEEVTPPAPVEVHAYCQRQLVLDAIADPAAPAVPLPPTTSTE